MISLLGPVRRGPQAPLMLGKALPRRHASPDGTDTDDVFRRLAELWAQLAQLDPEVGRRLPTYEA